MGLTESDSLDGFSQRRASHQVPAIARYVPVRTAATTSRAPVEVIGHKMPDDTKGSQLQSAGNFAALACSRYRG